MESYDIIDGQRVPGAVISSDQVITGTHRGSLRIEGCAVVIIGEVHGSVSVSQGATLGLEGTLHGSTSVSDGGLISISGRLYGSISIDATSKVIIEPSGSLSGSMSNNGDLLIRGVFGGAYSGRGMIRTEGAGYIKQPRIENGVHYYD